MTFYHITLETYDIISKKNFHITVRMILNNCNSRTFNLIQFSRILHATKNGNSFKDRPELLQWTMAAVHGELTELPWQLEAAWWTPLVLSCLLQTRCFSVALDAGPAVMLRNQSIIRQLINQSNNWLINKVGSLQAWWSEKWFKLLYTNTASYHTCQHLKSKKRNHQWWTPEWLLVLPRWITWFVCFPY